MHTWHSDNPTRHASAIVTTKQISPPNKMRCYIIQILQIVQILQIMQSHPRKAVHQFITVHVCSISMCSSCRSCRLHPVEVFRSSRVTHKFIDDTDPTRTINTWMIQIPSNHFLLSSTLSFEQHSSPCLLYAKTYESIEDYRILRFAFGNITILLYITHHSVQILQIMQTRKLCISSSRYMYVRLACVVHADRADSTL